MTPDILIPAIPAGITVLLNFFAPYATALIVSPVWPTAAKKAVAIIVPLLLAGVVLVLAFVGFGIEIPAWPVLLLLAVTVSQASYDLVTKRSADKLAVATSSSVVVQEDPASRERSIAVAVRKAVQGNPEISLAAQDTIAREVSEALRDS
jgi:hypothetical protein